MKSVAKGCGLRTIVPRVVFVAKAGNAPKLDYDDILPIRKLIKAGWSDIDIAEAYTKRTSPGTVYAFRRRWKITGVMGTRTYSLCSAMTGSTYEKMQASQRQYYVNNQKSIRAKQKKWYAKHRKKILARQKKS